MTMKYTGFIDWLTQNIKFFQYALKEGEGYVDLQTGEIKNRTNLSAWWQQFGVGTLLLIFGAFMLIRLIK